MKDFLTAPQVAQQIQKDVSLVQRLCRQGAFEGAFKVNPNAKTSPWLIPIVAVEKYQAEKTAVSLADETQS